MNATALVAAVLLLAPIAVAEAAQPNVVLIVADDLGYSDLGSYGGEIDTPHLDRLALGGVRFSRFYATPRCSPSRASLLTGVWAHEAGVAHLDRDWERPAYRGSIHPRVPTLAERMRAAGYATYMVGKWHLSAERPADGAAVGEQRPPPEAPAGDEERSGAVEAAIAPPSWPLQRGFDRWYGILGGSGSYFDPPDLYQGNRPVPAVATVTTAGAGSGVASGAANGRGDDDAAAATYYLTDELGARGAELVAEHLRSTPEQPFLLYLAFTAPHWPLHARAGDVARYRGRFDAGWDELRAARFARMRELGLLDAMDELPPRDPRVPAWSEAADRDWQARRMEVYAAMVSAMDRAAGEVIAALEAAGELDDTLVVFLSDNGACAEEFVGLYRLAPLFVPIPERTADGRAVRFGDEPSIVPGPPDTFSTYGRAWAHLSNTPLRLYKHWTHEGGISVPFFVHWPAGLAERSGAIVREPAHVVDVVPTLLEVAAEHAEAPTEAALRGESLLPLLRGAPRGARRFFWEHEGNRAVLDGDVKLVSRWPGSWELYDLAVDRAETNDLAGERPEQVAELAARWSGWAAEVGVEPWPVVVPQVRLVVSVAALLLLAFVGLRRLARGLQERPAPVPPPPPSKRAAAAPPRRRWEDPHTGRMPKAHDAGAPPPIEPR